jgi:hypothetical protein
MQNQKFLIAYTMNSKIKQLLILCLLLMSSVMCFSQQTIKSWEYWFDTNIGGRTVMAITPVAQLNLSQPISANALTNGFHVIHIRFKDDSARYSSVISQHFYKAPLLSGDTNKITDYEYWIDNNIGARISNSITPQNNPQVVAGLDLSAITSGFHVFNIRFKDERKMWSSAQSQYFYKAPVLSGAVNKIVAYEYWTDNNYAGKVLMNVSPQNSLQLIAGANLTALAGGFHVFNIRFKDEMKQWSSVQSYHFYKSPVVAASANRITAYEYWFDGNYSGKVFQPVTPQNQLQLITGINASALTDGFHLFNIRFKDERGMWSAAHTNHFYNGGNITGIPDAVNGYRYWFDNNLTTLTTVNLANTINPANLNELINTNVLDTGNHIIDMQFRDLQGDWSSALHGTFFRTCSGALASITPDGPTSFCAGDSVILTASSGLSYHWATGQSGQSITVYNTTLEYVTVTNYSGCVKASNSLQVTTYPLPNVSLAPINPSTVCLNYAPFLLTGGLPSGTGGVYSGDAVSGGSFYPANAGLGSHVITYTYTNSNNCSNSATASILVDQCVGVDDNPNIESIIVYPNPASVQVNIQIPPQFGQTKILEVLDCVGQKQFEKTNDFTDIDISSLTSGLYFLVITNKDNERQIIKIIKE